MAVTNLRYTYKTKPYSHQKKALSKIYKRNGVAALFMEMGTGKTKVAIDWASLSYHNFGLRRVVILCPISVMDVWKKQIRQHSPVPARVAVLHGPLKERIRLLSMMRRSPAKDRIEWVIINYEGLWRFDKSGHRLEDEVIKWKPDLVIADESHKIKTPMSKQSRSAYRVAQTVKMRLLLTGTPITKSPLDVFGQFRFLDSTVFGTHWTTFKRTYGVWGGFGGYKLKRYKNLKNLVENVKKYSYRVKKEHCLDLPPRLGAAVDGKSPQVIQVEMSEKAVRLYTTMAREMVAEFEEKEVTASIVLTKILRLSQITSGFVKDVDGNILDIDTNKVDVCIDLINDMVEQDEKVVVFVRFIHDYERLSQALDKAHIGHVILSGATKQPDRAGLIERFGKDPDVSVFIAQVASGSLGIDLTAASLCIFYSWDYRWDNYVQAVDRLHRHGQTRKCTYYHLAVPRSIDTESLHILQEKGNLAEAIIHNPRVLVPTLGLASKR